MEKALFLLSGAKTFVIVCSQKGLKRGPVLEHSRKAIAPCEAWHNMFLLWMMRKFEVTPPDLSTPLTSLFI